MTKLADMHATILNLAKQCELENTRGRNTELIECLAAACNHLAHAYTVMREVELHEEFHMGPAEEEWPLPGENTLKDISN